MNFISNNITDKEIESYALEFVRSLENSLRGMIPGIYFNPFQQNQLLKDINMNPMKFNREEIERLISDPKYNEDAIRSLSQYLYDYIMHYKRLIVYFGHLLTFDHYLEPTNADEEDMKSSVFKKSLNKAISFIEKINIKLTFPQIMQGVLLEDVKYYYIRENENAVVFQEMPSKWCKIIRNTEFGYQYALNMSYFMQQGVNILDYPPEFMDYFEEYKNSSSFKNGYPFWKELDPTVAPVFKFDLPRAGVIPPFMGSFLDAFELPNYRDLVKNKTQLDATKIILNKIPISKNASRKNDFLIDAKEAGKFNAIVKNAIPKLIKSITTPFETDTVDFTDSENKNNIAEIGDSLFYQTSGTSRLFFGSDPSSQSGIRASQKTDEIFVKHMYGQFSRLLNYQLKKKTGRYRFKIHFEGTVWDSQERFDNAIKFAQSGGPVTYVMVAMGKAPWEVSNIINFENSLKIKDKMIPLKTSHTSSNGRPEKSISQLGDAGEATRDSGGNDR